MLKKHQTRNLISLFLADMQTQRKAMMSPETFTDQN
jgi:hypothetical protein